MSFRGEIGEVRETGRRGDTVSIEWRIPGYLSLDASQGDYYGSPEFDGCGGAWYLRIHPKGLFQDSASNEVCIVLYMGALDPVLNLRLMLGIRGPEGIENRRFKWQEFSSDDDACLWNAFCLRSDLEEEESGLMQGDDFVLTLNMQPNDARGEKEVLKSLHELLTGGNDSDILINVQGREFPTHKAILRARCPVFYDIVEKQSGVITMEDCDPESFPLFLEHIYTGSTGMISVGNVFSLYPSADKYDLGALKEACREFMKNNLTVSCFFDAITLAVKHDDEKLKCYATEFFESNAEEILKTDDWQIFLKENTTVVNELLIKAFQSRRVTINVMKFMLSHK